jgi:hypothetical protein
VDDDCRPRRDTPSSKPKKEWKTSIQYMKRASSTLMEPVESAPFRSSPFPNCLLHAEAELKPKKAFKTSVQKTDAAGACGLSLVRCGELAHAALGKDSPLIQRMKGACVGESPQTMDAFLGIVRDSLDELKRVKKEIFQVANMGSKIAAGIFNQGIQEQRDLVCDSTSAKSVCSTLELCKPSLTHLFGRDESCIDKLVEAAKFRPYQASSFRPKAPSSHRSSGFQEGQYSKKAPYSKGKKSFQPRKTTGKTKGPASRRGEGQKKK